MDTGRSIRERRRADPLREVDDALRAQIEQKTPDLDGLEQGELSNDRASGLQAALGNQTDRKSVV